VIIIFGNDNIFIAGRYKSLGRMRAFECSFHAYPVDSQDELSEISFSPHAPDSSTYIALCMEHYFGEGCFGK